MADKNHKKQGQLSHHGDHMDDHCHPVEHMDQG